MDQVTCLSSADEGDVVAVTVMVDPTVTDVEPEKEMEVTGVDVETAISVRVCDPSSTPPTLSTLALAPMLMVPALEMVPEIFPRYPPKRGCNRQPFVGVCIMETGYQTGK